MTSSGSGLGRVAVEAEATTLSKKGVQRIQPRVEGCLLFVGHPANHELRGIVFFRKSVELSKDNGMADHSKVGEAKRALEESRSLRGVVGVAEGVVTIKPVDL
jgi:hypothetical protein